MKVQKNIFILYVGSKFTINKIKANINYVSEYEFNMYMFVCMFAFFYLKDAFPTKHVSF